MNLSKILFWLVVLVQLPVLMMYAIRMWGAEHYQFFPLMIALIAGLLYRELPKIKLAATPPSTSWVCGLLVGVLVLDFLAIGLQSSFVGAFALFLLLVTWVFWWYGNGGLKAALPTLALGAFIIPFPVHLDDGLIFRLQFVASQMASWMLDSVGQIHFREGVVLKTASHGFLAEEACSGIRSLFSALAGIAVYGVANNYPWFRHLLNLVQTLFWVLVGNGLRIFLVVLISESGRDWIAEGNPHATLGFLVFWLIFLMAVSTDRLMGIFFVSSRDLAKQELELKQAKSRRKSQSANSSGEEQTPADNSILRPMLDLPKLATVGLFVLFVGIGICGIRMAYLQRTTGIGLGGISVQRLTFPVAQDMPSNIGDWRQVSFEHIHRGSSGLQAEDSFVWTFQRGDLTAYLSADCPWTQWHNLADCYSGLGWKTTLRHRLNESQRKSSVTMFKPGGKTGYSVFGVFDRNAQFINPPFSSGSFTGSAVLDRIGATYSKIFGINRGTSEDVPFTTLQLYCAPETPLGQAECSDLDQLFDQFVLASGRFPRFVSQIASQ